MTIGTIIDDDSPCAGCEFTAACKLDGYECAAFRQWCGSGVTAGRWRPEQRTRPATACENPAEAEREFQRQQRRWYKRTRKRVEVKLAASERGDSACISATPKKPPRPPRKTIRKAKPAPLGTYVTYRQHVARVGRDYLARLLRVTNSRAEAAVVAGLSRAHLYLLIRQFGIASNEEQSNGST